MKHEGMKDLLAFEALYRELYIRYEKIKAKILKPGTQVVIEQDLENIIPDFITDMKKYELGDKSFLLPYF